MSTDKPEIEISYAMDDSCQLQFWCYGHYDWGEFTDAIQNYIIAEGRDIPMWVVLQAPVKKVYQRKVPVRDNIVADIRHVYSDTRGRGATPVTLMDFWFPLHAYRGKP